MQTKPGLVNQTPATQVERPGPVSILAAILAALVVLCILSTFVFFFAKNASEITPMPTPTATLDQTAAAIASSAPSGMPAANVTPSPAAMQTLATAITTAPRSSTPAASGTPGGTFKTGASVTPTGVSF